MTLPLVVIVALAIGAVTGSGDSGSTAGPTSGALPPITAAAPPNGTAEQEPCTALLAKLPVQLGRLPGRVVHTTPDSPFVVAWGDPPVVLSCGVDRPKDLVPGSSTEFLTAGPGNGPFYDVTSGSDANVWTTVDRKPYISIAVPSRYQGADVLPPLSEAIAAALPAVCTTDPNEPDVAKLCTRRK